MALIHISKKEFDSIPSDYKSTYLDYEGLHPQRTGRRVAFLPGHGSTLFVEGINFVVDGDQSHLPVICKENAEVGAMYQGAGGPVTVTRVYRLSEAEAAEKDLLYLDRAEIKSPAGQPVDFALPGSALVGSRLSGYVGP